MAANSKANPSKLPESAWGLRLDAERARRGQPSRASGSKTLASTAAKCFARPRARANSISAALRASQLSSQSQLIGLARRTFPRRTLQLAFKAALLWLCFTGARRAAH